MATSRISRVGSGSAETTTITIPAGHQAGDQIIIFANRDNNTANPTIPAGWITITNTADGPSQSASVGWKRAASASETSGTWTNATHLICLVYRGADPTSPFGAPVTTGGSSASLTYPATNVSGIDRTDNQWFIAFAGHGSNDTTTIGNNPTGFTNILTLLGTLGDVAAFDTNAAVSTGFASSVVPTGGSPNDFVTVIVPMYPPKMSLNNYQSAHVAASGISVTEKIR